MSGRRFTFPASCLDNNDIKRRNRRHRMSSREPDDNSGRSHSSGSSISSHSDAGSERSAHLKIIYKDAEGEVHSFPVTDTCVTEDMDQFTSAASADHSSIWAKFMDAHTCYDLIPTSTKLVVFDSTLSVKKAFYALISHGVRSAPLWDSTKQGFVGMLAVTDFIHVLHKFHKSGSPDDLDNFLEQASLSSWREALKHQKHHMIWIHPEASLCEAVRVLVRNKVHRLPVIDSTTGNALCILTHKRILKFLMLYLDQWLHLSFNSEGQVAQGGAPETALPEMLSLTLGELKRVLGSYHSIETVTMETKVIDALKKFVTRRVSALPVVDDQGKIVELYTKSDVINLAIHKTYHDLNITIGQAIEQRTEWFEEVFKCHITDTLAQVLDSFVKNEAHRLIVVDDDKVVGMVSLSDILRYLVLKGGSLGDQTTIHRKSVIEEGRIELITITQQSDDGDDPFRTSLPVSDHRPFPVRCDSEPDS